MTTVTDSIINIIIIIAVIVALSIVVPSTVVRSSARDVEQDRDVWLEERTNFGVEAVFDSTENRSGRPLKELIAESIFTLRTELTFDGQTVSIPNETKKRMDLAFGEDMYYMRVEPVIQGVNLMFVLDSSPTVEEERITIANNIGNIRKSLEDQISITGKEKVTVQIFMLPTTGDSECDVFTSQNVPELSCIQLTEETLYRELDSRGWERPGFRPGNNYETWLSETHIATPVDFAMSDWAAGVSAALWEFKKDPFLQIQTSINMIFPLSDELSTTSKADECFNKADHARYFMCILCDGNCPTQRSLDAVNQAIEIVENSSSIVFPIYSVNCDYDYDSALNLISYNTDSYIQGFIDPPPASFSDTDYPTITWCSQSACSGCSSTNDGIAPDPDFCFHDSCHAELNNQMQMLADATGGRIFDVNDAGQIPDNVLSAFDRVVANFNFVIGFQDETRDRFVYTKIIELPNGALTKVEVWVYQDPPRMCTGPEPCTTPIGCEGTRECLNIVDGFGEFSQECVALDPDCTGAPCQTPQICVDDEGCIGLQECVIETGDTWGMLSPDCVKSDPMCKAPCVNNCFVEGEITCEETYPGSGVFWKKRCRADPDACLYWEPFRVCTEPCEEGIRCGEDPTCELDCTENSDCNEACSQNTLCPFDEDCEAACSVGPQCGNEGVCNLLCSPQYPGGCPLDLDCPSCTNRRGDACPNPPLSDNDCCSAGESFIWGRRYNDPDNWRGYSQCDRNSGCYGSCGIPSFGTCCDDSTDCVIISSPSYSPYCINEGTIVEDYFLLHPDGQYICAGNALEPCEPSSYCVSNPGDSRCSLSKTLSDGTTYNCDWETGDWVTA